MATIDECRAALGQLVARLGVDGLQRTSSFDRTISCHVPDLDVTFSGRLSNGQVTALSGTGSSIDEEGVEYDALA